MPKITYTKEEIDAINAKQLLTVKEAAVVLGMHPDTVYRLIREKKLPVYRIGNRTVRVPREKLLGDLGGCPGKQERGFLHGLL